MKSNFFGLSRHALGLFTALFAVLILSLDSILIRKLGNTPNFVVIFYKNFFFSIPLILYMLITNGVYGMIEKFRAIGPIGLLAGLVWGAANFTITYGIQITAVATVLVIVAANPMFTALFSYVILKEPVPWYTGLAGLVCFGAILLIFYSELTGSNDPNIGGLLLALACAVTTGLYFVLLRLIDNQSGRPSGSLDPMPCIIIAGLSAALVALILDPNQRITDGMSGLYLFVDGVVVLGISFSLLNLCPSMISPTEVSLMMLVQTGLGPVFVYLAGYEAPPDTAIYGGCALAVALIVHSYLAMRYDTSSSSNSNNNSSNSNDKDTDVNSTSADKNTAVGHSGDKGEECGASLESGVTSDHNSDNTADVEDPRDIIQDSGDVYLSENKDLDNTLFGLEEA